MTEESDYYASIQEWRATNSLIFQS